MDVDRPGDPDAHAAAANEADDEEMRDEAAVLTSLMLAPDSPAPDLPIRPRDLYSEEDGEESADVEMATNTVEDQVSRSLCW